MARHRATQQRGHRAVPDMQEASVREVQALGSVGMPLVYSCDMVLVLLRVVVHRT